MSKDALPKWAEVQKRTFTNWVNVHLSKRNTHIDDLALDFHDGLKLIALLEVISEKKFPRYNKEVKRQPQKAENVSIALQFLKDQGIKMVGIGADDIVDGRAKLVLGLIWTIIQKYQIQKGKTGGGSAKDDLLAWVNKTIPSHSVKNFKNDWKDGKALCALVNALRPGVADVSADASPLQAATVASEAAFKHLSIPALVAPADMTSDDVDDLSMMTYISYFRDYDQNPRKAESSEAEHTSSSSLVGDLSSATKGATVSVAATTSAHTSTSASASAATLDPDDNISPSKCDVYGPGLENVEVGRRNIFIVQTIDKKGNDITTGGATFDLKVTGPDGGDVKPGPAKDNKDGTYTLVYTPTVPGEHRLELSYKSVPLSGSPFTVIAKGTAVAKSEAVEVSQHTGFDVSAFAKECEVDFAGLGSAPTTDGYLFFIVGSKGKRLPADYKYTVDIIQLPEYADVESKVTDEGDGTYKAVFRPPGSGLYRIEVHIVSTTSDKKVKVKGSPFKIEISIQTELVQQSAGVGAVGSAFDELLSGATVDLSTLGNGPDEEGYLYFVIKTKTLQKGWHYSSKIVYGDTDEEVTSKVVKDSDSSYKVLFKIHKAGAYLINVSLVHTDEHGATVKSTAVRGSPFNLTLQVTEGASYHGAGTTTTTTTSFVTEGGKRRRRRRRKSGGGSGSESASGSSSGSEKEGKVRKAKGGQLSFDDYLHGTTVDLATLGNGPDHDGNLHFVIKTKLLPTGWYFDPMIVYREDDDEVTSKVVKDGDAAYKVLFKITKAGAYLIDLTLVQVDEHGAKVKSAAVKGSPFKLTLQLTEGTVTHTAGKALPQAELSAGAAHVSEGGKSRRRGRKAAGGSGSDSSSDSGSDKGKGGKSRSKGKKADESSSDSDKEGKGKRRSGRKGKKDGDSSSDSDKEKGGRRRKGGDDDDKLKAQKERDAELERLERERENERERKEKEREERLREREREREEELQKEKEKERQRREKEEADKERADRERADKERAAREHEEKERIEKERREKEQEAARVEKERREREEADRERAERDRIEREEADKARAERDRKERDRKEKERIQIEKELEREREEERQRELERVEKERASAERERLAKEKELERERELEKEREEKEKRARERAEREKERELEREREQERLQHEKQEQEKRDKADREEAEKARAEKEARLHAGDTKVDLSSLSGQPDDDGELSLSFGAHGKDLADSHYEAKAHFLEDGSDVPVRIVSEHGKHKLRFSPHKTGSYVFTLTLHYHGHSYPVSGSPFTVNITVPELLLLEEVAQGFSIDPSGLGQLSNDGEVSFVVKNDGGKTLPDGVRFETKVVYKVTDTVVTSRTKPHSDGGFEVLFAPRKPGQYTILVHLVDADGKTWPVNGTPITLTLEINALENAAQQAEVDLSGVHAGHAEGGVASFIIGSRGKRLPERTHYTSKILLEGKEVQSHVSEKERGVYEVSFQPTHTGEYIIHVYLVDEEERTNVEVGGSPFTAHIQAKAAVDPAVEFAAENTLVDTSDLGDPTPSGEVGIIVGAPGKKLPAGSHYVSKIVRVADGADVRSTVSADVGGSYKVVFKPTASGEYNVEISLVDKHGAAVPIKGSPFTVNIDLDTIKTSLAEKALTAIAQTTSLDLAALGTEFNEAGEVSFLINLEKPLPSRIQYLPKIIYEKERSAVIPTRFIEEEGALRVVFAPPRSGEYETQVWVVDEDGVSVPVNETPYNTTINIPTAAIAAINPPPQTHADPGRPLSVDELSQGFHSAGGEELSDGGFAFLIGFKDKQLPDGYFVDVRVNAVADGSDIEARVSDGGDGITRVEFNPPTAGEYIVSAGLVDQEGNGAEINGSPFHINVAKPSPEKEARSFAADTFVDFNGFDRPRYDGTTSFIIGTRGKNLPTARYHYEPRIICVSNGKAIVGAKAIDQKNGTFKVSFAPPTSGDYFVEVDLIDKDDKKYTVKGSPFTVNVNLLKSPAPSPMFHQPGTLGGRRVGAPASPNPVVGTGKTWQRPAATGGGNVPKPVVPPWVQKSGKVWKNPAAPAPSFTSPAPSPVPTSPAAAPRFSYPAATTSAPKPGATAAGAAAYGAAVASSYGQAGSGNYQAAAHSGGAGQGHGVSAAPSYGGGAPSYGGGAASYGGGGGFGGTASGSIPRSGSGSGLATKKIGVANVAAVYTTTAQELGLAEGQNFDVQLEGPSGILPVEISFEGDGIFKISYTPVSAGDHKISFIRMGQLVLEDVLPVDEGADEGESLAVTFSMTLEARTRDGKPKVRGGDKFQVKINGPKGPVYSVQVMDQNNGKHVVNYTLPGHGDYELNVTLNGRPLANSPWRQQV